MTRLEHIGIASADGARAVALIERLLGLRPYKSETVASEGVRTHFIDAGGARLEILEALGPSSPIARFLEKRGDGLHHLAFEVDDVEAAFARLAAAGFSPLGDAPKRGADGKRIFFLHPRDTHGMLIECCQSERARLAARRLSFRTGALTYYEAGTPGRPAVVVLHGLAGSTERETEPLVRVLERRFHVLALDFAGHGDSDAFRDVPFSLAFFADQVKALLAATGLSRTHLFGFSLGGAVALHLCAASPEACGRAVVYGTPHAWDAEQVARMVARLEGLDDPRFAAFARTLPDHYLGAADFARIQAHVLVAAADRDDLFARAQILDLHDALPSARLALLPAPRHALANADPEVLGVLALSHLQDNGRET